LAGAVQFGHRHFGIYFKPKLSLYSDGLEYRGRRYVWSDVEFVDVHDPGRLSFLAGYPGGIPRMRIRLKDGSVIRINGRSLEKRGTKPRVGFWTSRSDAFEELVMVLKRHVA
jgi:hypothetical protein